MWRGEGLGWSPGGLEGYRVGISKHGVEPRIWKYLESDSRIKVLLMVLFRVVLAGLIGIRIIYCILLYFIAGFLAEWLATAQLTPSQLMFQQGNRIVYSC